MQFADENYYTSGRGTELKLCRLSVDLYIGGETGKLINLGFPQCKTIIMPLIFQSPVPLFLRLLLSVLPRCAKSALITGHATLNMDIPLLPTVFFAPGVGKKSRYIFSKFDPLNTDTPLSLKKSTPLIRTL